MNSRYAAGRGTTVATFLFMDAVVCGDRNSPAQMKRQRVAPRLSSSNIIFETAVSPLTDLLPTLKPA